MYKKNTLFIRVFLDLLMSFIWLCYWYSHSECTSKITNSIVAVDWIVNQQYFTCF